MRIGEIEKLLAAFYEGKTSEYQEKVLKEYLRTHNVPNHLKRDKELFMGFHQDAPADIPAGLEERLNRMIDKKEQEEIRLFQKNRSRRHWRWVCGVAASLMLSIGIYSIYTFYHNPDMSKETFTDPQVAYEVLQATLMEVSMGLNTGVDEVVDSQKEIKRTHWEIKQDLLSH